MQSSNNMPRMFDPYDPLRDGGYYETGPAVSASVSSASAPILPGESARRRLVIGYVPTDDVTVEQWCTLALGGGATDRLTVSLSEGQTHVVLRYEDIGDAIFAPVFVVAISGGSVFVRSVRWHDYKKGA